MSWAASSTVFSASDCLTAHFGALSGLRWRRRQALRWTLEQQGAGGGLYGGYAIPGGS
jgi:hypothetical protein